MNALLALDPGTKHPALAVFLDGRLRFVTVGEPPKTEASARAPKAIGAYLRRRALDILDKTITLADLKQDPEYGHGAGPLLTVETVVEWPVAYRSKTAAHKDVERLKAVCTGLAGSGDYFTKYTPRAWKGAVPKPAHHARVARFLTEDVFSPGLWKCVRPTTAYVGGLASWWEGIGPDARDAVALGLFHLGVTGRGGTKP